MIYLLKTRTGEAFEIGQAAKDSLSAMFKKPRSEWPAFIEVGRFKELVSTATINCVVFLRDEPKRLPSSEEELADINAEWRKHESGSGDPI